MGPNTTAVEADNQRLCGVLLDVMRVLRAIEGGSEDEAAAVEAARIKIEDVLGLRKNSAVDVVSASPSTGDSGSHRCSGCGRVFRSAQGLGMHFTAVRKREGVGCSTLNRGVS